jgi:hypothetical protein
MIRSQKPAKPRHLKYKISIYHKGELLAEDEVDSNDDILDLVREREFSMLHSIGQLASKVLPLALKEYEFNKTHPKQNGETSISE